MSPEDIQAALLEHARTTRRQRHEIKSLPIDGKPLEFWCLPLSAQDMGAYGARLLAGEGDVFVDLMVDKAETEKGERLFKPGAVKWLKPIVHAEALAEISIAMGAGETGIDQLEDALGNSDGIRSSEQS